MLQDLAPDGLEAGDSPCFVLLGNLSVCGICGGQEEAHRRMTQRRATLGGSRLQVPRSVTLVY